MADSKNQNMSSDENLSKKPTATAEQSNKSTGNQINRQQGQKQDQKQSQDFNKSSVNRDAAKQTDIDQNMSSNKGGRTMGSTGSGGVSTADVGAGTKNRKQSEDV